MDSRYLEVDKRSADQSQTAVRAEPRIPAAREQIVAQLIHHHQEPARSPCLEA